MLEPRDKDKGWISDVRITKGARYPSQTRWQRFKFWIHNHWLKIRRCIGE